MVEQQDNLIVQLLKTHANVEYADPILRRLVQDENKSSMNTKINMRKVSESQRNLLNLA